jgi:exodeoxyribonuclease V alpha subunit
MTIDQALERLKKSKFRSSFHLSSEDVSYINQKGMDTIEKHARDFIRKRLAPAYIENDGSQTPTKGHPVFKAQHACACCCRSCLNKWYRVPKGGLLTEEQQDKIVKLLLQWIKNQYNIFREGK